MFKETTVNTELVCVSSRLFQLRRILTKTKALLTDKKRQASQYCVDLKVFVDCFAEPHAACAERVSALDAESSERVSCIVGKAAEYGVQSIQQIAAKIIAGLEGYAKTILDGAKDPRFETFMAAVNSGSVESKHKELLAVCSSDEAALSK